MAVIGVITCEVLEREFAHILANDAEVSRISVLEDKRSARLIGLLEQEGLSPVLRMPHASAFRPDPTEKIEVVVRVLGLMLHRSRPMLRHALTEAAQQLRPHVSALMLGYGQCGGALDDPAAVLDVDIPVFVPMDNGRPVDDCVGLCLGGHYAYYAEQRKVPGTYFLTPGWTCHWKQMLAGTPGDAGPVMLRRILANYERALLVPSPAAQEVEMRVQAEEFCRQTGLRLEVRPGTLRLLNEAWRSAKNYAKR